jgi:hypothetical protein
MGWIKTNSNQIRKTRGTDRGGLLNTSKKIKALYAFRRRRSSEGKSKQIANLGQIPSRIKAVCRHDFCGMWGNDPLMQWLSSSLLEFGGGMYACSRCAFLAKEEEFLDSTPIALRVSGCLLARGGGYMVFNHF